MDWKKRLEAAISVGSSTDYDDEALNAFIETQIIEKLIEEIPDTYAMPRITVHHTPRDEEYTTDATMFKKNPLKQQLRAKWLGKDSHESKG